ncbi:MAG: CinA family nicotinamide mononucleotide deamidase-related protein [Anaerolineae bacterium]
MDAEIITIGTELLLGHIIDTNAAWLAQQLAAIGLNLYRKTTVGDNEARIAAAISESLDRSDVIITSGGLGPTVDDKTREAVAQACGRELVLHPELLESIRRIFDRRGFVLTDNNMRQAYVPADSIPIPNPVGTAPCFAVPVERGGRTRYVICLPGVPRELKYQMEHAVIPLLREKLGLSAVIKSRILRVAGMTESRVDQIIGDLEEATNPTVGLAAHPGQIDVRITARAESEAEADAMIATVESQIRERIGKYIFGVDAETLEDTVSRLLAERGLTIATVETNTGGRIAQRLSQAAGRTQAPVLKESIVAVSPDVLLRVTGAASEAELISLASAEQAANHAREASGADLGLAIISPNEGLDPYSERPGATYIVLANADMHASRNLRFGGTGDMSISWAGTAALDLTRRYLLNIPED